MPKKPLFSMSGLCHGLGCREQLPQCAELRSVWLAGARSFVTGAEFGTEEESNRLYSQKRFVKIPLLGCPNGGGVRD